MATTFRAAYIPAEPGSTGGGIRLTEEADQHLGDAELRAKAEAEKASAGVGGEIVIGDWSE